jgi:integrase/recombinase XerD
MQIINYFNIIKMGQFYSISIYLDTRRAKSSGKFPLKLRVYTSYPRIQKMFPTIFELTEKEFDSIWKTLKPRKEYQEIRRKIQALETQANNVAESLKPFTFEKFERKLYRKAGEGINIKILYNLKIDELNKQERIATASSNECSLNSFEKFVKSSSRQSFSKLNLYDITEKWLKDYENFMVKKSGKSYTTVGIYLRTLRSIFNDAIVDNEIENEFYPFGKKKYQIPATQKTKRAFTNEQLSILFNYKPKIEQQQMAKDFWFFSFSCNGMNIKDIVSLKQKDIKDRKFDFYRAKTKLTSISNSKPITVYLNDFSEEIIKKYGNNSNDPESYVFNILSNNLTAKQKHNIKNNFIRSINQHLKNLCKELQLPEDISTYWARHSFATNSIRKGLSMEFMQESLGHKDLKTTENYFAGFENDVKREFANNVMDFN